MSWWEIFWFFLPAGLANMSPVIANRIPGLNQWKTPLDCGHKFRGKRLLGDNKTWRGLVFGTFAAAVFGLIQYRVIASSVESTVFIVGATGAMGFGALIGDAVESFFKRQKGVKSGDSWFPFDQIDYIIGGLLFVLPFVGLSLEIIIKTLALYFTLHLMVSYIGYRLGLKDKPI